MIDRIMTLHPQGNHGTNTSSARHDTIRGAIVEALTAGELTFKPLMRDVRRRLQDSFEGSINRYVTTVKLDLEARGVMERVPGSRPQRLRVAEQEGAG